MKGAILLGLCTLAILVISIAASDEKQPIVGGSQPIKNVDDPNVKQIAEFAVSAYNKQSKSNLLLEKVLNGTTQIVAGIKYSLHLTAVSPNGVKHAYDAVVIEKTWLKERSLISFTESGDEP